MQTFLSLLSFSMLALIIFIMLAIIFWPAAKKEVSSLSQYDDDYVTLALKIRNCETDKDCAKALTALIAFHRRYKEVPCIRDDVAALAEILEEKEINGLNFS